MSDTTTSTPAVFLDRDGTIVHEAPNYITQPQDLHLIDGAGQALRRLRAAGYKLVVITNQACLAKGMLEEKTLEQIHERMRSLLAEEAVQLDSIYFCGIFGNNIENSISISQFFMMKRPYSRLLAPCFVNQSFSLRIIFKKFMFFIFRTGWFFCVTKM